MYRGQMSGHAVVGAVTRRRKSNDADRFRQITQSDWLYAARQQHSVARRYRRVTGHRQDSGGSVQLAATKRAYESLRSAQRSDSNCCILRCVGGARDF